MATAILRGGHSAGLFEPWPSCWGSSGTSRNRMLGRPMTMAHWTLTVAWLYRVPQRRIGRYIQTGWASPGKDFLRDTRTGFSRWSKGGAQLKLYHPLSSEIRYENTFVTTYLSCFIVNDPSEGSPTDTLLRLLLPLSSRTCTSSQHTKSRPKPAYGTNPKCSFSMTIGSSDGRCVQRAGT